MCFFVNLAHFQLMSYRAAALICALTHTHTHTHTHAHTQTHKEKTPTHSMLCPHKHTRASIYGRSIFTEHTVYRSHTHTHTYFILYITVETYSWCNISLPNIATKSSPISLKSLGYFLSSFLFFNKHIPS